MAEIPPTFDPPTNPSGPDGPPARGGAMARLRRWSVPVGAALAVVAGGVAVGLVASAVDDALPARSAEQLIADVLTASPEGVQGTVAVRMDLGLPPLPIPSAGSADLGSLISGNHSLRLWYSSPDKARMALLGRDGETDVIINGTEVWVWSSRDNTAHHSSLPAGGLFSGGLPAGGLAALFGGLGIPDAAPGGPPAASIQVDIDAQRAQQLASLAVAFLEPSTEITTTNDAEVAGRRAYELVLRPRDSASLIDRVVLAIDAQEHVPLRFAVLPRGGGAPAIEIAFTQVSFARPDPAQFTFNPPPGATVVDGSPSGIDLPLLPTPPVWPGTPDGGPGAVDAPDKPGPETPLPHTPLPEVQIPERPAGAGMAGEPAVDLPLPGMALPGAALPDMVPAGGRPFSIVGSAWTAVVVVKLPVTGAPDGTTGLAALLPLLQRVEGDWGSGRLLPTRLFTVLFTDDGRLIAGAVTADRLYEVAAER